MTLYIASNLKATTVKRQDDSPIVWLQNQHQNERDNLRQHPLLMDPSTSSEDKLSLLKQMKRENMSFMLASAFGDINDPKTPTISPRKVRENGGLLRKYIAIDYDFNEGQESLLNNLWEKVLTLFTQTYPARIAIYPSSSYPILPRIRVVIETDEWLDKRSYPSAAEFIINLIGFDTYDDDANLSINHSFNAPWYWHPDVSSKSHFTPNNNPLSLEELGWERPTTKKKEKEKTIAPYRGDQLEPAIEAFISNPETIANLQNFDYFWRFAESLADAYLSDLINMEFVEHILEVVALGNETWEKNNITLFQEQIQKLKNNPDKRSLVKPLGTYLPIINQVQDESITNLARLLARLIPPNLEGDVDVQDACDIISQFFEFGILPGIESNVEALAIFNPLNGLWVHNVDDLVAMLTVVKPALTQVQVKTALMYWAAQANKNDNYLKPYSGSQYLVFENGVLDIVTLTLHPLNSTLVKDLQFTSRHQLKINYNPNPELVVYEQDTITGEDWSIEQFIQAYADNDETTRDYLLFGLSLGLFPNHTFGVTFDIQGSSGSGKSTLSTIYKGLYGTRRVAEILFSDMNKDFPLNTYNYDTAIIWAKECNVGSNELSDEYGVNFYDSLADPMARIPVKHGGDIIVENPPQLFVDGTVFISAEELNSGVSRRTLAYKLPDPIEPLRGQYYSNNITERLLDERNLQYLVVEMIKAYKTFVPEFRWKNFKMNLGIKSDVELLPKMARDWRYEFVSADANLRVWYEEQIQEHLMIDSIDDDKWVTDEFFHRLYLGYYTQKNPQDKSQRFAKRLPNFSKVFHQILEEEQLYRIEYRDSNMRNRKKLSNPDGWGFNWELYSEMWIMPESLERTNAPEIYQKKVSGYYELVSEKPNDKEYTLTKDGTYAPIKPTKEMRN